MTYDGIFEKCKTLAELHRVKNEMRAKYNDPISIADQERAFKIRIAQIMDEKKERCFG